MRRTAANAVPRPRHGEIGEGTGQRPMSSTEGGSRRGRAAFAQEPIELINEDGATCEWLIGFILSGLIGALASSRSL